VPNNSHQLGMHAACTGMGVTASSQRTPLSAELFGLSKRSKNIHCRSPAAGSCEPRGLPLARTEVR
jgi:hypothetical protein